MIYLIVNSSFFGGFKFYIMHQAVVDELLILFMEVLHKIAFTLLQVTNVNLTCPVGLTCQKGQASVDGIHTHTQLIDRRNDIHSLDNWGKHGRSHVCLHTVLQHPHSQYGMTRRRRDYGYTYYACIHLAMYGVLTWQHSQYW